MGFDNRSQEDFPIIQVVPVGFHYAQVEKIYIITVMNAKFYFYRLLSQLVHSFAMYFFHPEHYH
jgi:hypothetical protein